MLKSTAFVKTAALAALLAGLSSATAQASETPPDGISCSGVLTFISGPQTSLQCSSQLVLQHGLLQAINSISIEAVDSILIGKDMVVQAHDIFLSSNTIVIDGILNSTDDGHIQITGASLDGGGDINGGGINSGIITVGNPTLSVPEASTTLMAILGLLTLLGWKTQSRILPVKTCQNITQSPMKL